MITLQNRLINAIMRLGDKRIFRDANNLAKMFKRYDEGWTILEISRHYSVDRKTIYYHLNKRDITLHPIIKSIGDGASFRTRIRKSHINESGQRENMGKLTYKEYQEANKK